MRLTFRVASAGGGCIFRYPNLGSEDSVKTNGVYDAEKCQKLLGALQDLGYGMCSSGDRRNAIICATSFLFNMRECAERMITKAKARRDAGDTAAPHADADTPSDRRAYKKLDTGKGAFVRVDIRDKWPIEIIVSWANPAGGDMQDEWCRDLALLCVEIADAMREKSGGKCVAVEGHRCAGFISKAREVAKIRS